MKLVINVCFGGFSLSPRGIKRWAELKGRECYFFRMQRNADGGLNFHAYEPISLEQAEDEFMWHAYDVSERPRTPENWHELSNDEKQRISAEQEAHSLYHDHIPRDDADLVRVVEELGGGHRVGASGKCAELQVVEIPDGVEWQIEAYDGNEHIAETHRTWR